MGDWKTLRINLNEEKFSYEVINENYKFLGGRSFTSKFISNFTPPNCDPLGKNNNLILATGLLAGSGASSSTRLSIGAKSPLTGGIKESNVGGSAGRALANLCLRSIVIEGQFSAPNSIIHVSKNGVEFRTINDLFRKDIYSTVEILFKEYGRNISILAIGPAGEMKLAASNIGVTDGDGIPSRHAGRGGLGAVMGSKNIKAIIFDPSSSSPPSPVDKIKLEFSIRNFTKSLLSNPVTGKSLPEYGTAVLVNLINNIGGLPTRNFKQGVFEHASELSGEKLREIILERKGKTTHSCMPGCVIRCSNTFPDKSGVEITRGFEYESIVLLGSNCGIGKLEDIAILNRRCDELGLDTMDIGVAIGIAMENGLIEFGDVDGVIYLLNEIEKESILGKVIGNGANLTGKVLGASRIPTVRGQAISAYDPRILKGTGVTYTTSPMGADHTAGNALPGSKLSDGSTPITTSSDNQIELSGYLQLLAMVFDSVGLCWFSRNPILENRNILINMLDSYLGGKWDFDNLLQFAKQTLKIEKHFNSQAGLPITEDLPEFFREEPITSNKYIFDISLEDLSRTFQNM